MTENEAIKTINDKYETFFALSTTSDFDLAMATAIKALEEIQSYRAIGTVERFRFLQEVCDLNGDELEHIANSMIELKNYRKIGTVEDVSEIFSLCKTLQDIVKKYSEIGTIEEFKALKEKSVEKKPIHHGLRKYKVICPHCNKWLEAHSSKVFCCWCGGKIDWSE